MGLARERDQDEGQPAHLHIERMRFLEAALEQSTEAAIVVDADGRLAFMNDAARRLTQRAIAPGTPMPERIAILKLRHADGRTMEPEGTPLGRALRGERIIGLEMILGCADGRDVFLTASASPVNDAQGRRIGGVVTFRDVGAQKRTDEALRMSEANYRAIFDSANDAIFVHDAKTGAILDVNQKMTELYGYSRAEARHLRVETLSASTPPFTEKEALVWLRRAAAGEPQLFEWLAKGRNGQPFWVEVNIKRVAIGGEDRLLAIVRDISKRKQDEEALCSANQALRVYARIVENSPDLMSIVDRQYVYRMANPTYARMHGRPLTEIEGHAVAEVIGEELFQKIIRPHLDRCFAGQPVHYETWVDHAAAGRTYQDVHYFPLFDDGRVEYAVVISRNITELKQAEEERSRLAAERAARAEADAARRQVTDILESITDGFLAVDGNWRFTYVNSAAERLLMRRREELLGKSLWEELPGSVGSAFTAEYYKVIAKQTTVSFEALYQQLNMSLEVRSYPTRDGVSIYFRDITQRKRAQEALRESEERFRLLLQTATAVIMMLSPDGRILEFNPEAEQLYGRKREEVLGKDYFTLFLPEGVQDGVMADMRKVLAGEPTRGFENAVRAHDGTERILTWNVNRVLDARGEPVGVVAVGQDVTERKRAEQFREEYVALISHDLRNPLAVLIGQSQWLRRLLVQKGLEREAESAGAMLSNARRMNAMIGDLVETAHLESGYLEMHKEPTDLVGLVREIGGRVGSLEDRARIQVEVLGQLPSVLVDQERMERAIVNLITNALKYSPPDRPVIVRLAAHDGEVCLAVIDQGVGIPVEDIPHLFERFYRAQTGKKAEGLGLGLYITRLIVEAHGGRILVESEVDRGSTFCISLPAA